MDPASSSVGFPLSGNPQSPETPPPLHPPSVGIPRSESSHSTESSSPTLPSSSPIGTPLSSNPQSTEPYCNGPPTFVVLAEHWNLEMTKLLFHDENFKNYMIGGECQDPYMQWFLCMNNAVDHHTGDWGSCTELAGVLRDCVFANLDYYKPLITYFSDNPRRY